MVNTRSNRTRSAALAPAVLVEEPAIRGSGQVRGIERRGWGRTTLARGRAQAVVGWANERKAFPPLSQDHFEEKKAAEEQDMEPEVAVPVGVIALPLMSVEVIQQGLSFLSRLAGTGENPHCSGLSGFNCAPYY